MTLLGSNTKKRKTNSSVFSKKSLWIIFAAFLAVILLLIIILISGHKKREDKPKNELLSFQLNEFDSALIEYLCSNGYDSSDFLISPVSLRASLCLAAVGAQGKTRQELVNAAGFSGMESFSAWYSMLKNAEKSFADQNIRGCKFSVENSVWSNKNLLSDFTDSYASAIAEQYNAGAYSFESDEFTQAINSWVNEKTDGFIPIIAEDMTGASSALISALLLRNSWDTVFSKAEATESVVLDINGKEQTVSFMEQTGEYLYTEESGTKIVVIPLKGNMSFVCFLGNRIDMFSKTKNLKTELVHLVLPKFELESTFDSKDISGFLLSRGVLEAIDEKNANFYNMCQGTSWFIQETLQKTTLAIDEEGVGFAKANVKPGTCKTYEQSKVIDFTANVPFSFAVFSDIESTDRQMLLYGQLMSIG